jgi:hypothetical protein
MEETHLFVQSTALQRAADAGTVRRHLRSLNHHRNGHARPHWREGDSAGDCARRRVEAHIVEIRDHRGAVVLSGEFRSRVDGLGNTEKDAALTDRRGRTVIGEVELEIPAALRENRRPELEVDIIGLPGREAFSIVIDDRIVGWFTTDDRGSVDMELQEGEVPPRPSESWFPRGSATSTDS